MPGMTDTSGETCGILELLNGNLARIWKTKDVTAIWILEMIMEKV